jgi:hypothetical protein
MSPLNHVARAVALATAIASAGCSSSETGESKDIPAAARTNAAAKVDPCAVVTPEEVKAAVGWTVQKSQLNGAVCNFTGPNEFRDMAAVLVSAGMRTMASSEEMAKWRLDQTKGESYKDIKFIIEPIPDLGVPAIRNEVEGAGIVGVESYVRGRLLTISTATLEGSKALTRSAIPRIP